MLLAAQASLDRIKYQFQGIDNKGSETQSNGSNRTI
jgi:hypothetical protein